MASHTKARVRATSKSRHSKSRHATRNVLGQGSNPRKWHTKAFKEDATFEHCFSDSLTEEKYGRLTDIVALSADDSYCCCLSQQSKENLGIGGKVPKNYWDHAFSM